MTIALAPQGVFALTAHELLEQYARRALSPLEVTQAQLERIEALQPVLNCFQLVDAEGALEAARQSTRRWQRGQPQGPLDGVPVTVKDNLLLRGHPTRSGSATVSVDQPWTEDAPAVARLREAGAVLLGKTTLPEFGWKAFTDGPLFGTTRNPHALGHTPGGSTGGGAAALAAGIGPLALGNDGGGSLRVPASYSGLFGIKPTFGRVPHAPQESASATVVSDGPLTRSVADAALMLDAIARPDFRDAYALPPPAESFLRGLEDGIRGSLIGFSSSLGGAEPRPEVLAAFQGALPVFSASGAALEEVGALFEPLQPVFEPYWYAGFGHTLSRIPEPQRALMDPGLRFLGELGLQVTLLDYQNALVERARLTARFNEFFTRYDLLVTPTMPTPAPTVETRYHSTQFNRWREGVPFTLPFNLTGHPAASIPCGVTAQGLPIGLQLVGPRFGELAVLRACRAFEAAQSQPYPPPRGAA